MSLSLGVLYVWNGFSHHDAFYSNMNCISICVVFLLVVFISLSGIFSSLPLPVVSLPALPLSCVSPSLAPYPLPLSGGQPCMESPLFNLDAMKIDPAIRYKIRIKQIKGRKLTLKIFLMECLVLSPANGLQSGTNDGRQVSQTGALHLSISG